MKRVLPVCLGLLLVATACANDSELREELRVAAETTAQAGTLRFWFERRQTESEATPLSGEGLADLSSGDQILTITGSGASGEFREIGGTIYSLVGGDVPEIIRGFWIATSEPPSRPEFNQLFQSPGGIPLSVLTEDKGIKKVKREGTDTVRDVQTTRYRAEIEPVEAIPEIVSMAEGLDETMLDQTRDAMDGTLEVWVDEDNLIRRIRLEITEPRKEGGLPYTPYVQTIELFDFGTADPIEPPPAEQVKTEEQLGQEIQALQEQQQAEQEAE